MKRRFGRLVLAVVALTAVAAASSAQEQLLVSNRGFASVLEVMKRSCEMCHEWAGSHEGLTAPALVTPGAPESSALYTSVAGDSMPPMDPRLTAGEKELLRRWIAAGASATDEPLLAAAGAETTQPAATPLPAGPKKYLGFSSKVRFHQVSGFTSASLLLAAGLAGTAQWATYISEGHEYRDANNIDEDQISSVCADYISGLWGSPLHTSLRWTHVGLMVSGETLYLANAFTGVGMISKNRPGLTAADLHRYAFYTHGVLMIAEVVMGFMTTSVLKSGNHELMIGFGAAHSAIGLAIPLVMIGSGIAVNHMFPKP